MKQDKNGKNKFTLKDYISWGLVVIGILFGSFKAVQNKQLKVENNQLELEITQLGNNQQQLYNVAYMIQQNNYYSNDPEALREGIDTIVVGSAPDPSVIFTPPRK